MPASGVESKYTFKQTWALSEPPSNQARTVVKGSRQTLALSEPPSNQARTVVKGSRVIKTSETSTRNMGCCGLTMNTVVLRTPAGILKIFEFVIVIICLMLARFGGPQGNILNFGDDHHKFLGPSGSVSMGSMGSWEPINF